MWCVQTKFLKLWHGYFNSGLRYNRFSDTDNGSFISLLFIDINFEQQSESELRTSGIIEEWLVTVDYTFDLLKVRSVTNWIYLTETKHFNWHTGRNWRTSRGILQANWETSMQVGVRRVFNSRRFAFGVIQGLFFWICGAKRERKELTEIWADFFKIVLCTWWSVFCSGRNIWKRNWGYYQRSFQLCEKLKCLSNLNQLPLRSRNWMSVGM